MPVAPPSGLRGVGSWRDVEIIGQLLFVVLLPDGMGGNTHPHSGVDLIEGAGKRRGMVRPRRKGIRNVV